jgi:biopolymer transport protein ExbB
MIFFETLGGIFELGGPVIAVLLVMSVLTLTVTLYKIWQFSVSGVGRHRVLSDALQLWDSGEQSAARVRLKASHSYLAPLLENAMEGLDRSGIEARLDAEAGMALASLERGFRLLDTITQIAPLLGLFGTVIGMIEAFRSLQGAGSSVDPSLLAGGIWVALLTTAVGLAVAIPTSLVLAWLESRTARERVFADKALRTVLVPEKHSQDTGSELHSPQANA